MTEAAVAAIGETLRAVQQRVEEDPVLHQLAVPLERPPLRRERGVDVLLEREEDQERDRQQKEDQDREKR